MTLTPSDIADIINQSQLYNFHSHTQFCDGRASMEEMVIAAINAGMTHWGFSPHSPVPIDSPCNMSMDDVPTYLAEVDRLRRLYGHNIKLYAAMEMDYLSHDQGPASEPLRSLPLDYRIGSVHFVPANEGYVDIDGNFESFRRKIDHHFGGDIDHVVRSFFSQSFDMIDQGGFEIIGHFDKIGLNASLYAPGIEERSWYQALVSRLIDRIIDADIAVEINTKAFERHNRFFPKTRYWKRLLNNGVTLVVNSDAHYPERVAHGRADALNQLSHYSHHHLHHDYAR